MQNYEIIDRLREVRLVAPHDYEVAHIREDALFEAFIRHVATRRDAIGRKAEMVLQSKGIEFSRVCS